MNDLEYATAVNKFINEILPQAGKLSFDIGNLNELAMETTKRLEAEQTSPSGDRQ